jgi:hypothetical protein
VEQTGQNPHSIQTGRRRTRSRSRRTRRRKRRRRRMRRRDAVSDAVLVQLQTCEILSSLIIIT